MAESESNKTKDCGLKSNTVEEANGATDLEQTREPELSVETKETVAIEIENSSESKKSRGLLKLLRLFTDNSTLHGLPHVTTEKTRAWIRVFWALFMAAGFALAVWQCIGIFAEYFRYPVSTLFEVRQEELIYPQVTVCNQNGYFRSKVANHSLLSKHPFFTENDEFLSHDLSMEIQRLPLEERMVLRYGNITDFVKVSDDMVRKFSMKSNEPYSLFHTGETYCVVLFPNPRETNRQGIDIKINMQVDEYIDKQADPSIRIFIREAGTLPVAYSDYYFDLAPGYHVDAELSLEVIHRLNGNYGNCPDDEDKYRSETGYLYSKDLCNYIYFNEILISKCGCVWDKLPKSFKVSKYHNTFPYCYYGNTSKCYFDLFFYLENIDFPCKPRCHMNRYSLSKTKTVIAGNTRYWLCSDFRDLCTDYYGNNKWVMSNTALITLRFPDQLHSKITQVPSYPLSYLLSDLGGTFGLCLGASLLTFCEIPQVIIGLMIQLVVRGQGRT